VAPRGDAARRFEALQFSWLPAAVHPKTSGLFAINAQQIARGWLAIELTGTNAGLGVISSPSGWMS
jgi:hypothetical protein